MSEFNFLKNAGGCQVFKPIAMPYSQYKFILKEITEQQEYEVMLLNVPVNSILLRLDENKFDVSGIFNSSISNVYEGICKKADYILIDNDNRKVHFIELKLGNSFTKKEITQQLIGAECIFQYINHLIANYCKNKNWDREAPFSDYIYNYIAICNIKVIRKASYHKNSNSTSPQEFLRIDNANNISYKRL
ncbi:Uncharacterised protein [Stutzerimonas stutzeri]|nr:Uncharacterised protein [Stutzerimonas stutzeri]